MRLLTPFTYHSPLVRFGFALLVTAAALGITLAFPASPDRPYYFFLGAIALATWYGGWTAGLISTVLSAVCSGLFILLPLGSVYTEAAIWRYVGFVATCVLIFGLSALLHNTADALQKSHLRFGGVVQISEDAIMTVNDGMEITLFNPGAEKIFGYTADEMIGKSVHLLLPERFRRMHDAHMRAFATSADQLRPMNRRGTIYGLRKDGSEFPAEASISKFEANGETIMTVRLRDISERVAAEQGLRRLAAIVESSQDAIVGENLEGKITAWSPGAERMYGYTVDEAVGRDARMLLPPDAADEVGDNIARAGHGDSYAYETVRMTKDGRRIDVAVSVSPIYNDERQVEGVSAIQRDITERRRLEEQLRHSQKMEAVGRLAGGVAHDFNNLLSIIVGYTYLIQSSTAEGDSLRSAADQIMSAAEKAGSLTRQLLAFSRKQVLRPEVIDLNEITAGLGKMLGRLVGEDVDVRIVQGERLRNVKADPSQLEQVIMNLVVNARDAMPNGGKLTIETANVYFDDDEARQHNVAPGDYVMLAVSDTGIGMDEETRTHMFEPFFTTKEAGKGTGLGLATVYGIVSQSNGYIWVYSEPQQGTTFKIYFPATAGEAARTRAAKRPELSLCGTETILLVEDEARLRELIEHVLSDKGYHVVAAANGPEALRILATHTSSIDLMLTDVVMPAMRGQELAEQLRERYPNMAVIYMSGYTDNALMHSGALPEGTAFLQKPFTPDVVLRRIRDVLDEVPAQARRRAASGRRTLPVVRQS